MAGINFEDVSVDVGDAYVGEVTTEVGEVYVGEIERSVHIDVRVDEFYDACSESEIDELLNRMNSDDHIEGWLENIQDTDLLTNFKTIISNCLKNLGAVEEEKEVVDVHQAADAMLKNTPAMPTLEIARMLRAVLDTSPEQLQAFPKAVLKELSEKLGEAAKPIIIYEIPPDLKAMITAMEPGEVEESFVSDLQSQIG